MARSRSNWAQVFKTNLSHLLPPERQRQHAAIARRILGEHLAGLSGRPPAITTIVDGRVGASEDSVRPGGIIRYEFSYFREVAAVALEEARSLSPVDSGRYRDSWIVMADGVTVPGPDEIPDGALRVVITNEQPYHRKIHTGAMEGLRVPAYIVDRLRAFVHRRFGNLVDSNVRFILLENGYILKGRQRSSSVKELAAWHGVPEEVIKGWRAAGKKLGTVDLTKRVSLVNDRRSAAFREGRAHLKTRADTQAGQPMTYPALELTLR